MTQCAESPIGLRRVNAYYAFRTYFKACSSRKGVAALSGPYAPITIIPVSGILPLWDAHQIARILGTIFMFRELMVEFV